MANKSYVGDIGTIIEVDMGTDISHASLVELHVKKPGGSSVEWTGAVYDTNYIRYSTVDGDFSLPGLYLVNPYIEIGNWKGYGETVSFRVYRKYS